MNDAAATRPTTRRRGPFWAIVVVVLLGFAGFVLLLAGGLKALQERVFASVTASEQQLVYATNHQQLLDACDQVRANPTLLLTTTAPTTAPIISVVGPGAGAIAPATLPPALKALNFESITVEGERVVIMFGGGFYHWGFEATQGRRQWGEWELIPGLWYWNEGGSFPPDPAQAPRVRSSTKLICGGVFVLAVACALPLLRARRLKRTAARNALRDGEA